MRADGTFEGEDKSEIPFEEWDTFAELQNDTSQGNKKADSSEVDARSVPFENWDSPADSENDKRPLYHGLLLNLSRRSVVKFGSLIAGSFALVPLLDGSSGDVSHQTTATGKRTFGYGGRPIAGQSVPTATESTEDTDNSPEITAPSNTAKRAPNPADTGSETTTEQTPPVVTPSEIPTTETPSVTPVGTTATRIKTAETPSSQQSDAGDGSFGGAGSGDRFGGDSTSSGGSSTSTSTLTTNEYGLGKQGYGEHGYGGIVTD